MIRDPELLKKLLRFEMIDVVIAIGLAGFVNAAMLIDELALFCKLKILNGNPQNIVFAKPLAIGSK